MTFQEINYFLCHAICSPLLFEAMVQFQIIPSHYPLNAQLSLNPPYLHLCLIELEFLKPQVQVPRILSANHEN